MKRMRIDSTGIASVGYDVLHQVLEVQFIADGQTCHYHGVPEHVWYGLRASGSISNYFRTKIMGFYHEEAITEF